MQDTMFMPVSGDATGIPASSIPARTDAPAPSLIKPATASSSKLETGLGAWASAISADDNAQAAIALAEAINRARNSQANREHRAADARVIAVSRLETLRARLAPVYAAIPRDVELFDLGLVGHTPPRLFVDIIAFVELTEDGKRFRLQQESRSGRMVLGEATDERQMTSLVTNYIAERLVERERALAAQGIHARGPALPKAVPPGEIANVAPVISPAPLNAPPEAVAVGESTSDASVPADLASGAVVTDGSATAVQPVMAMRENSGDAATATAAGAVDQMAATRNAMAQTALDAARQMPGAGATAAIAATGAAAPSATMRRPAPASRGNGGWVWPLVALLIGIGLGALALYLYAANLARP